MDSGENTAPGTAPLLFVSYSRTDLPRAEPVIALLEKAGFAVWWDGRLEGGENYLQTTETALENAACVVVLWSATSVASHWVRDEAQRGRERGCLVPLTIDGTMAPLGFRQFQLLDISGWDGRADSAEAARILVAVRARLGGEATPQVPGTAASPPVTPPRVPETPGLSRRTLMIGGLGGAAAGLLGAWRFGLLGSPASAATSMVVMPFANETGDPDKKFFSDGLARELRTILSRNPRLKVAAPTSSSAIADEDDFEIGRKLGVGSILRGSVQRDNARVRVTAELVEIQGGLVRWAETYDRALESIFALQSEIAETVALSLVAEVAGDAEAKEAAAAQGDIGGTQSVAAYEAFLRGLALYDVSAGEETDRAALAQFEKAAAEDPGYAAAHAWRSTMLAAIANNVASAQGESRQLFDAAVAAAEKAIAIEKRLARGHLALGFALNNGRLDRTGAAPHYRAAETLAPGDADVLRAVASFHAYGADLALAGKMIDTVLELDPLNARAFRSAGYVALFARDYPAVVRRMERALALNPSLASAQFGIAVARLMQGDAAGALAAAKAEQGAAYSVSLIAIAKHRLGDAAGSDEALANLAAVFDDSDYQQAEVHAQRGDIPVALAKLEEAYAKRDPGLLWLRNDPLLDPLRAESRFKELLSRLGS
ncbi:TIR domain-containing protein [Porphyrobacter sp. AAP82]|uniref:TIR domain-containing protein n=1 Tax=Porphyrobacter sp. AAP82 TaxID=1248917 RepID=UPI0002FBD67B|nr:TIR domain-containing protein [Porphyrobacter sp. AAP82]